MLVKFPGCDQREGPVLVDQGPAIEVAVRAVGAQPGADRVVLRKAAAASARAAAGTIVFAVGEIAVVTGVILAGREHRAELQAVPDRRFVPDRVRGAPIEL